MSIKVMTAVWDYSRASGTPLLVLLKLADWANDDGECWPSISTIAQKCRLKDERHVKRIIHETLERDLSEVVVIPGGGKASSKGGLRSNRYRIIVHMPEEEELIVAEGPLSATNDGGSQTIQIVAEGPPRIVVEGPPEPSIEPSLKQPLNPQPKAGDQKPLRRGMRGTGTSPRELQAAERVAQKQERREWQQEHYVTAIPDKYAHHPEIAEAKIREAFADDPERLARSLEHLARLVAVAS
jgi:hypothetical protein